ncbi:MAG: hypothetical protein JW929_03000 [Anaerolineales bacterium]|nr:hypothetical protein [Anaerolineales bacterium]
MTDLTAFSLLLTKIAVPAARPRVIPRTRLLDPGDEDPGFRLLLVCAPAGYGKTTFLTEWARRRRERGTAVAWYALDPGDDDPVLFGSYLTASLDRALGPDSTRTQISGFLRSSPDVDLRRVLPPLLNSLAQDGPDLLLVLDDYQSIQSPAIHEAVGYLLEHLPDRMCLAVGSRSDPPLPWARHRARGRLKELRADALRFSREETDLFLRDVMRMEIPADWIDILEQRTEGWAAGLQLAALSLAGPSGGESAIRSLDGSSRLLVDYLWQEVFSRQAKSVRLFLLLTSVLDRMHASLCDLITGCSDESAAVLKRLERDNLFIAALDDRGEWYRYHPLFRDFLQDRLQKEHPSRIPGLHRAAAEWHSKHGYLREAVRCAFRAGDWPFAAAMVERHGADMVMRGETAAVREWCDTFPEDEMRNHPGLCLIQSNALLLGYRERDRRKILERLTQVERTAMEMGDRRTARILMGQAATTRTFLEATTWNPEVDPRRQFDLAQTAMDLLAEDDPARSALGLTVGYAHMALQDARAGSEAMERAKELSAAGRNFFGIAEAAFHQARLAQAQGHLRQAEAICRQAHADLADLTGGAGSSLPAAGCLDLALGEVFLERDRLDEAERFFSHGLERIGWGMNPYYQMIACRGLFRLRAIQARQDDAFGFLSRLEDAWPEVDFLSRGLRIELRIRLSPQRRKRGMAEADAWDRSFSRSLDSADFLPGMGPLGAAEAYYLAYLIRTWISIAAGRSQTALAYLERQLESAATNGLAQRIMELSLLQAQALHRQGEDRRVWKALERALEAGQAEGFIHTFDQGPESQSLLAAAYRRGIYAEYVGTILSAISPSPHRPGRAFEEDGLPGVPSPLSLSGREMEVLRLLARGNSNREIAERLVITVGTVKTHINHILEKIGAGNRTEAVARARERGILDR